MESSREGDGMMQGRAGIKSSFERSGYKSIKQMTGACRRQTRQSDRDGKARMSERFRQNEGRMMERQVNILISLQADVFSLTGCQLSALLSVEDESSDRFFQRYLRTKAAVALMRSEGGAKYPLFIFLLSFSVWL